MEKVGDLPILKHNVRLLETALKDLEPGTFLSYDELNKFADIDVRKYRSVLESVKRSLLRDYGRLLVNARNRGFQIARPEEFSTVVNANLKGIGRKIRSNKRIIEKVEWQKLDRNQTQDALETAGKLSMLSVTFKATDKKQIANKIDWAKLPSEESVISFLLARAQIESKEAK